MNKDKSYLVLCRLNNGEMKDHLHGTIIAQNEHDAILYAMSYLVKQLENGNDNNLIKCYESQGSLVLIFIDEYGSQKQYIYNDFIAEL